MTDKQEWGGDEQSIDERIRALAAGYHKPEGPVPRDEMWAAIAPAWRAAQTTPAVVALPGRFRTTRWRWSAALAAGLLLGIALDRGLVSYHERTRVAATPAPRDSARVAQSPRTPDSTKPAASAPSTPDAPRVARESVPAPVQRVAERAPVRETNPAVVPRDDSRSDVGRSDTPVDATARRLYHAAALQTLAQAEALLTAYRSGEDARPDAESMRLAARWARDVLSSTRLLLDSPAARDAQLRALLTDLELVLAQIVQRSGAPLEAGERDLIERAMRDRDLLPRLRSAVPAGMTASD